MATLTRLWVERKNGVPNAASASGAPQREATDFARFRRIAELLQAVRVHKVATIHPEEHLAEVGSPSPRRR